MNPKNAIEMALNSSGEMYLAPLASLPSSNDSITPHPMRHDPHVLPVSQITSRVNNARGTMSALPVIASTDDNTERPSSELGFAKLFASCATGIVMNSSVALHPEGRSIQAIVGVELKGVRLS